MILIDENKLTNGTITLIGSDLGIEGFDPDSWMKDMNEYN